MYIPWLHKETFEIRPCSDSAALSELLAYLDTMPDEGDAHNYVGDHVAALKHLLLVEKRFGPTCENFWVWTHYGKLALFGGNYTCREYSDVMIGGCRTWIDNDFRGKIHLNDMLLPYFFEQGRRHGRPKMWFTFNEHNKPLYDVAVRYSNSSVAKRTRMAQYKPIGTRQIQGVIQYVLERMYG